MRAAVGVGVHQDGAAGRAIAAGAADLLVIRFQAARQRGVNHGAHVRFVDPHAEGDGGDHHLDAALEEFLLDALAVLGVEPGMVGGAGKVAGKFGGHGGGLRARRRIHDGGAALVLVEQFQGEVGALRGRHFDHFDRQIVAAEAVDETRGLIERQLHGDIVLHDGRGGCGERDDRRGAQGRQILAEHAVIGAEIVAPLRNAMRFVDGDERRLALGEHFGKAGDAQTLRRDEEELQRAVEIVDAGLAGGGAVAAGVNALDGEVALLESWPTWSSISAISGLITSVVPPRAMAGNW